MSATFNTHTLIEGGGKGGVGEREGEGRKRENVGWGGWENENENSQLFISSYTERSFNKKHPIFDFCHILGYPDQYK